MPLKNIVSAVAEHTMRAVDPRSGGAVRAGARGQKGRVAGGHIDWSASAAQRAPQQRHTADQCVLDTRDGRHER